MIKVLQFTYQVRRSVKGIHPAVVLHNERRLFYEFWQWHLLNSWDLICRDKNCRHPLSFLQCHFHPVKNWNRLKQPFCLHRQSNRESTRMNRFFKFPQGRFRKQQPVFEHRRKHWVLCLNTFLVLHLGFPYNVSVLFFLNFNRFFSKQFFSGLSKRIFHKTLRKIHEGGPRPRRRKFNRWNFSPSF